MAVIPIMLANGFTITILISEASIRTQAACAGVSTVMEQVNGSIRKVVRLLKFYSGEGNHNFKSPNYGSVQIFNVLASVEIIAFENIKDWTRILSIRTLVWSLPFQVAVSFPALVGSRAVPMWCAYEARMSAKAHAEWLKSLFSTFLVKKSRIID